MNKNGSKNYKVFDEETIRKFENRYEVQYKNPFIIVNVKGKEMYRAYKAKKQFRIYLDPYNLTLKMTILPLAVQYWNKDFKDKYSLFRVQNTMNILNLLHEEITEDNVKAELEKSV